MKIGYLIIGLWILPFLLKGQHVEELPLAITSSVSFRGLSVVDSNILWISGKNGMVCKSVDGGRNWVKQQLIGFEKDDFRSIHAWSEKEAIICNTSSPGIILKTKDGGTTWDTVYQNTNSNVFLDAILFVDSRGFVFGDPIDSTQLFLLSSYDRGAHWTVEKNTPMLATGEAGFAASNGILAIHNNILYIGTGGLKSRLWQYTIKEKKWTSYDCVLDQHKPSCGIFAIAVNTNGLLMAVGGDYENPSLKLQTTAMYKLEQLLPSIDIAPALGYRSGLCHVYDKTWVSTGTNGIDISKDDGITWQNLSKSANYHAVKKAPNSMILYAIGANSSILKIRF